MGLFKPDVLKMRKKRDVRGLIKALSHKSVEVRSSACSALGILGDKSAVDPLIIALNDKEVQVRRDAAYVLGSLGDPRASSALLAALSDKSTFNMVAQALAKLKEPRLLDLLLPLLNDDTMCSQVASALGTLGDLRAVEPLIELFNREDTETRRSVVFALSNLHDVRAAGVFRNALKDEDGTIRRAAINALCRLPGGLERETLVSLLHDPDFDVRGTAAYNLESIGIPEEPEIQAWYAACRGKWDMAVKLGHVAAEPLFLTATQAKDKEERVRAAIALSKLGDRRALEPLLSGLNYALAKPQVCIDTAQALGKLGDLRAMKPLQGLINTLYEPRVRQAAFSALSQLQIRQADIILNQSSPKQPVCALCGERIPALKSTIADDIRRGGGIVVGTGLDQVLFDGVICRTCGRVFCTKCHNLSEKGYNCQVCKHELSPLFADYLM